MGPLDLLNHLINFVAPACVVGGLLVLLAPLAHASLATTIGKSRQFALNSALGVAALAAGLWFFGHDGKMATYAAMVLAIASGQWLGARAWR
jgi:hypothetical protein